MRMGAAGARQAANAEKKKQRVQSAKNREARELQKYGLVENTQKKEDIDPTLLRKYKDSPIEEPESFSLNKDVTNDGFYDHHAEILAAKK